jgi:NAD(P)-dependent dehydrogenase (short-subunit alcohol dehydrogenase family)
MQVEAAVNAAEQSTGPVDLLVACAGVYKDTGEQLSFCSGYVHLVLCSKGLCGSRVGGNVCKRCIPAEETHECQLILMLSPRVP